MLDIARTAEFTRWEQGLRDQIALARIAARIERLAAGNPGDSKSVGRGIMEMRINYGPGYRVYYTRRGDVLVILLIGGDKSTQSRDIRQATAIAATLEE
jgi:putative addiction module killer protein